MGNQSKMLIEMQLNKMVGNQYYIHSNNSIDLLDDIFEDHGEDQDDIGQAIQMSDENGKDMSIWLLPFKIYL